MKYIELVKGLFTADHEARAKQADPYVAYSVEANRLMFTIAPEPYFGPADNEIWYTSSDGNVVTPYSTSGFGANIVSNTYENSKGVITFDGPVTSIGKNAFKYARKLNSITIPNSVTSIGQSAFDGCYELTSAIIGNSVMRIEFCAFYVCRSLICINIPNSVTYISNSAFDGCSSLTSILVEDDNTTYDSRENCNAIIETTTNTLVRGCQNTIIPNSVASIGTSAFSRCTPLTSIVIPNGVTSIGSQTFWECTSLISITIPEGVTNIGSGAFYNCSSITFITIPNSVTSIGSDAFYGCNGLTAITIPNSVMSIGNRGFKGCSSLTSIIVEKGNSIYDSRENCNAIIETATNTLIAGCQNTIIPNSVTSIGESAFYYCKSITSITIPNNVTSIGREAFLYCSSLKTIICEATTPPILDSNNNISSVTAVYVPAESVEAYKVAPNWSYYANVIQPIS